MPRAIFITFFQSMMNSAEVSYVKFQTLGVCLYITTVYNHHRSHPSLKEFINQLQWKQMLKKTVAEQKL